MEKVREKETAVAKMKSLLKEIALEPEEVNGYLLRIKFFAGK